MTTLPRLLYIGDVPVEAGMGGSALLFRLLCEYPLDRVMIVQSRGGEGFERLFGAQYLVIKPIRYLPSRFSGLRAVASVIRSRLEVPSIARNIAAFQPHAVVTVTHGGEWITAWGVAERLELPLHLICHDDWEPFLPMPSFLRGWTRSLFARAYRKAASRLCVSPYMAAYYQQQYGAHGTVLYPSRAKDVISPNGPPEPRESNVFTIAYAGSLHGAFAPTLRALATTLHMLGGRLLIFSKTSTSTARELGLLSPNITLEPVLPPVALIERLRSKADALILVMRDVGLGSRICFPSKLVDYTATGLPIIISAPRESAPAYWVREHPSAAMLIEADDDKGLHAVVVELANDPAQRRALGIQAQQIGNVQFSYMRARDIFFAAVTQQHQ